MGALKSPRLGISLLNIGKPMLNYGAKNLDGTTSGTTYPGIFTPKAGFAATFIETGDMEAGFSADVSFPTFMNVTADLAVGFEYKDMISVDLAWEALNLREYIKGASCKWPSLGINAKFTINTSKIGQVSSDWEKSEICPSLAATNLYSGIVAVAAGTSLELGQKDTSAPEIILWNEDTEIVSEE